MNNENFVLSATVDFPDDVRTGPYDANLIGLLFDRLRALGVRRVYWLYYGDVDQESYCAGNLIQMMQYGSDTLQKIGEPVAAAVPIAHAKGLELYAVLKPFNTGIAATEPPSGSLPPGAAERVGGRVVQQIPFVERFPHTRIKRRVVADSCVGLGTERFIETIRLKKADAKPTRIDRNNVQVWTSPNNERYTLWDGDFRLQETVETAPADVTDYNGARLTSGGDPVRVLTLSGLSVQDPYVLVTTTFDDEHGDFRNSAVAMMEVRDNRGVGLPLVVATRGAMWAGPRSFRDGGLDFDSGFGHCAVTLDIDNSRVEAGPWWNKVNSGGIVGAAVCKNDHVVAPCVYYPEVRRLWRGWIERLVAAGVDGVDIRVSTHSTLTDDDQAFGFNEPVLAAYSNAYGTEPSGSDSDLRRLSELRGDRYTEFLREACAYVRGHGKKFQVHLHAEAFRDDPCHGRLMGFPSNVRFDWRTWLDEGLLDGVTLRTSWFEALEEASGDRGPARHLDDVLSDDVAREMLERCGTAGVSVYMNRYIDRSIEIDEYVDDIRRIHADERFAGFDIYETAHLLRAGPDGGDLDRYRGRYDRILAASKALGLAGRE